jgi:hypothetical protein
MTNIIKTNGAHSLNQSMRNIVKTNGTQSLNESMRNIIKQIAKSNHTYAATKKNSFIVHLTKKSQAIPK